MRGQQLPTAMRAMPAQGREHHCPTLLVEHIGTLEHSSTFRHDALWIGFQKTASHNIVIAIHRAHFITVQACAVAGERNEIPQKPLPCDRGSSLRSTTLEFPRPACIPDN